MFCVGTVAVAYAALAVLVHVVGADRWLPTQINTLVLVGLGVALLAARDRYVRLLDLQVRQLLVAEMQGESTRQYRVIKAGLIDLGARLGETTGEVRRLANDDRPIIDPSVMRLLGRLDREFGVDRSESPPPGQ